MICGIRLSMRLEKWLKRLWVNQEVFDLGVKNHDSEMKVSRVKLE